METQIEIKHRSLPGSMVVLALATIVVLTGLWALSALLLIKIGLIVDDPGEIWKPSIFFALVLLFSFITFGLSELSADADRNYARFVRRKLENTALRARTASLTGKLHAAETIAYHERDQRLSSDRRWRKWRR